MTHERRLLSSLLEFSRGLWHPLRASASQGVCSPEERVRELERENAALRQEIADLRIVSARREAELLARISELEERLNTSSRNSGLPASKDRPDQKPPRTRNGRLLEPGKRVAGGQRGHKGHTRAMLPDSEVPDTIDVPPPTVCECGGVVEPRGEPYCVQQAELPPIILTWRGFRLGRGVCLSCGRVHRAALPAGILPGMFGPNLLAFIGLLVGGYQLGRRGVRSLLSTLLNLDVSTGTLSRAERRLSEALVPVYDEAREAVIQTSALNLDETGSRREGKRSWIWLAASASIALFLVSAGRGAVALSALIGDTFKGFMTTDRWHTYNRHETKRRQICWAHLLRDFQKIADRGGNSSALGQALLAQGSAMFKLWGRFKDQEIDRTHLKTEMLPIQKSIDDLLAQGSALVKESKTAETCRNLLKLRDALWTFLDEEELEPTNNRAERLIRNAVVWRTRSQGTWSERGDRYVERLLTTVVSLRLQGRDPLKFLAQALRAHSGQGPRPSLLRP